ncbi:unnamed protein product [Parnassius mnemosyne]|uniref:DDE-1 domain-containing protein n=1 Tax=Parnassius mnemosyne TaxID=213953 RepID=A0AAV1LXC8_9NEOP
MFIYPRLRHSTALDSDEPRGTVYRCSKNGWINEELFVEWLKYFTKYAKPSESDPVLLLLDNHSSHISWNSYKFCKENHIVMLSLPPHGSHRIQPLDISIYGPLKTAYKQECNIFMKCKLGRKITQGDIASLFRKAFQRVATIPKAEAGFTASGIYSYNPNIFTDEDFLPAEIMNNSELIDVERCDHDNRIQDSPSLLDNSKATLQISQPNFNDHNDAISPSELPHVTSRNATLSPAIPQLDLFFYVGKSSWIPSATGATKRLCRTHSG